MWREEPEVITALERAERCCKWPIQLVVEMGSYAMHDHDARPRYPGARYVGIDCRPGPGVDIVGLAHEVVLDEGADLVLSISALEHDPHWLLTIGAMARAARPGGVICLTCPTEGWGKHEPEASPTPGYYGNVGLSQLVKAVDATGCQVLHSWETEALVHRGRGWLRGTVIARRP